MKAFVFPYDESNANFNPTPEYNVVFLRATHTYLNERIAQVGFLTLNDVLDQLGILRTVDGMVYGWMAKDGGINFGFDVRATGDITLAFLADNIYQIMGGI